MRSLVFILLLIAAFNYSCNNPENNLKVLAEVYGSKLYEKDINGQIPANLLKIDSLHWVDLYIKKWIKEEVLLHEAEKKLSASEKNKDLQLMQYKKELLIYELSKKLASESSDTIVSMSDIRNYYNLNRKEFELRKNITRLHYIKLRKDAPGIVKVKEWFQLSDSVSIKKLESYCGLYAENFFFNDKVWLSFDDILKEVPLKTYNEEEFLRNNKRTILEDFGYFYLIDIIDFRIKNGVSPLEFEIDNIKNILSNKKKLAGVEEIELKLLRKAQADGSIKILK